MDRIVEPGEIGVLPEPPRYLPVETTPFFGREQEAAAVRQWLLGSAVRLLTLTGPPGIGKTRLALRVAADLQDEFAAGVCFVSLDLVRDPQLVVPTLAHALGLRDVGLRPLFDSLKEYLQKTHLLLVLDNFEQVSAAAPLLVELLQAGARLKLLVTSRTALQLRGEQVLPVPPLPLPEQGGRPDVAGQAAAVRLFVERAQAAKPDFALTDGNVAAVVEICRRLDGMPLAIELAAARVAILPPAAMLSRLARRLTLLVGGLRDLPERQQTMRGAIAWSYELLQPAEQRLFRRLAVFVGGARLEAVEAVGNLGGDLALDVLQGMESLVHQSLLRADETGDEVRFRLLETVREYGWERLTESGELAAVERQHALYFLSLAEAADAQWEGPQPGEWLARLEEEHDNLRAALRWALDGGEPEIALRLAGSLGWFWFRRGYFDEGRGWLEKALAMGGQMRSLALTRAFHWTGQIALEQGDLPAAQLHFELGLSLCRELDDGPGTALALSYLGHLTVHQGDYAAGRRLIEQGVALYRQLASRKGLALALAALGVTLERQGALAAAAQAQEEAMAVARETGNSRVYAAARGRLARVLTYRGDYAAAHRLYAESLAAERAMGVKQDLPVLLVGFGELAIREGDYRLARSLLAEGLALGREHGNRLWMTAALERFAYLAAGLGQMERAARLGGTAEASREALGQPIPLVLQPFHEQNVAAARLALGEQAFAAAWAVGREMGLERAIEYALADAPPDKVAAPVQPRRAAGGGYPDDLTEREVEVLRLLASGKTNREIAAALVISLPTVERHVANVYAKTGVHGRAEAATYALRHNLLPSRQGAE